MPSDTSSETQLGEPSRLALQMRRHALRELEAADFVVLVSDSSDTRPPRPLPRRADLGVRTKSDISGDPDAVSALTGQGMDASKGTCEAARPASTPAAGAVGVRFSGSCGENSRQSESHHIDEAGQFPAMFEGFGDHRVGQHHEDGAPGKHVDERLCGSGSILEQYETRQ